MGSLSIVCLFFIWSLAFPLGKVMVGIAPPIFVVGVRMTLAGVLLLGYLLYKKQIPRISKKQVLSLCILALFSIYLTNILEYWSLKHLSAAKTCFLYGLSPFFTALLSYIHFSERMTSRKWVGMLIGFGGSIPVILEKCSSEQLLSAFLGFTWPEVAMLAAVFFSVYGWIILRLVVKEGEAPLSPLLANGGSMLIGGILALLTYLFFGEQESFLFSSKNQILELSGAIVFLTLLSNIICYNFYGYLLRKYTATLMSLFGLLSPIFTSFHSWVILHETPSLTIILSTFIVLLGLLIFYIEERNLGYIKMKSPLSKEERGT
jgi:drug/metabolite transporter (DMT)-like permease